MLQEGDGSGVPSNQRPLLDIMQHHIMKQISGQFCELNVSHREGCASSY